MNPVPHDAVAHRFSAAAGEYSVAADVQRRAADLVLGLCPHEPPLRILEIGCGTGLLTRGLLQRYPEADITALDFAEGMLAQARRETPSARRVTWVLGDARRFVLEPPARLAVSASSLQWIAPLGDTFLAIRRSLVRGARLVFAMMLDGSLSELRAARLTVAPAKPPRARLPREEEVLDALRGAGFALASSETLDLSARYADGAAFLQTLRRQGVTGGPVSSAARPLNRRELAALASHYDTHYKDPGGGVRATYRILAARARAEHV